MGLALAASAVCLATVRARFRDARPGIFLLGDSFIGNYRFDPGQRLQDQLESRNPGDRVENWGEPGASPGDFYLHTTADDWWRASPGWS